MGRCREDSSLARSPTQTSSNRGSSLPLTTYLPLSYLLFTNNYRPLPAAAKASERGRRTSQRRGGRAALRQRRAARAAHLQVRERRAGRLRPGVREGDHALSGRAGRATWRVSGEGVSPATRRVIGSCHHLFLRRRRVSPPVNRCIVSVFLKMAPRFTTRRLVLSISISLYQLSPGCSACYLPTLRRGGRRLSSTVHFES